MKLKDVVRKLAKKPDQDTEVQFCVWTEERGVLICAEMNGPMTHDLMRVFAKHAPRPNKKP